MMTQTQPTFGSQAIQQISQFTGIELQEVRAMVSAAETKAMNESREITIAFENGNLKAFFSVELLDAETFETSYNVTLIEEDQVEVAVEEVVATPEVKWESNRFECYSLVHLTSRRTGKERKEWCFTGHSPLPGKESEYVVSMKEKVTKQARWLMVEYKNGEMERYALEFFE